MDDDQDQLMEDLFGEAEHVSLTAAATPPAKGLAHRLDQLAASSCCQCVCQTFPCPSSFSPFLSLSLPLSPSLLYQYMRPPSHSLVSFLSLMVCKENCMVEIWLYSCRKRCREGCRSVYIYSGSQRWVMEYHRTYSSVAACCRQPSHRPHNMEPHGKRFDHCRLVRSHSHILDRLCSRPDDASKAGQQRPR
jgi:hypothetical protein